MKKLSWLLLAFILISFKSYSFSEFLSEGKFSCPLVEKCHIPTLEEIDNMRNRFLKESTAKLKKLQKDESEMQLYTESILGIASNYANQNNNELMEEFYFKLGSSYSGRISEIKFEYIQMMVSSESPFLYELNDLQGIFSGGPLGKNSENLSKREKYYQWYNRTFFKSLVQELRSIDKNFISVNWKEQLTQDIVSDMPFRFDSCPKNLEGKIRNEFLGTDFSKSHQKLEKFIHDSKGKLKVRCRPTSKKNINATFLKSTHQIIVPYIKGKVSSKAKVEGMFINL